MNASPPLCDRAPPGDGSIGPSRLRIVFLVVLVMVVARLETLAQQGVGEPPRITNQPQSQIVLVGGNVSFRVGVAVSATPLSYQWHSSTMPIPDATNVTLKFLNVQTNQAGPYWVTVVNATGSVDSQPATLTVIGPGGVGCADMQIGGTATQTFNNIGMTNQPSEPSACGVPGGASRCRCVRPDQDAISILDTIGSEIDTVLADYTFSGTNLNDSLDPVSCDDDSAPDGIRSLVRFPATQGTGYVIQVDGVNAQRGNITRTWGLGLPPVITQQPPSLVVAQEGGTALISCLSTGTPAPVYQWQFNGTNIPGATGSQLMLTHVRPEDAGLYRAIISNFIGVEITEAAGLQVTEPVRLAVLGFANNDLQLQVTGPPGATVRYVLEASSDFQDWTALATNNASSGSTIFLTPVATRSLQRFS